MRALTTTPVRGALAEDSTLQPHVKDGLGAVRSAHKAYFAEAIRPAFADSIDIDEALQGGHEQENRWDYLVGHAASGAVVAVEPHSAKDDEVSTVIAKRTAARDRSWPIPEIRRYCKEVLRSNCLGNRDPWMP